MPRGEDFTNQSNHAASPAAEVGGSQRILLAFARAAHRDALRQIGRSAVAGESAPRGVAARYLKKGQNMSADEITKIKAELFDLQTHNCNGTAIISEQGITGNGCTLCSRVLVLRNRLYDLEKAKKGTP
jgi:hypothetical protein